MRSNQFKIVVFSTIVFIIVFKWITLKFYSDQIDNKLKVTGLIKKKKTNFPWNKVETTIQKLFVKVIK